LKQKKVAWPAVKQPVLPKSSQFWTSGHWLYLEHCCFTTWPQM